jgi:hypothetical protein
MRRTKPPGKLITPHRRSRSPVPPPGFFLLGGLIALVCDLPNKQRRTPPSQVLLHRSREKPRSASILV